MLIVWLSVAFTVLNVLSVSGRASTFANGGVKKFNGQGQQHDF